MLFFIIDDPFGVVYKEDCLADTSEDIFVTRNYLKEYKTKKFNTFVFGNSRAHAFSVNANTKLFDFGSPGESVLNIKKKLALVLEKQKKIDKILILIDDGILENTDNTHRFYQGPVYIHTPISSNISYLKFYSSYIKYYFSNFFCIKYIYFKLSGNYNEHWMADAFKNPDVTFNYRCKNYPTLADSLLENNFEEYKRVFNPNYDTTYVIKPSISAIDLDHLNQIKKLLVQSNADYRIIFPPNFHKQKMDSKLKIIMNDLFASNFYDFSGRNIITTDSAMNYENLHFTFKAANLILDSMKFKLN